MDTNGLPPGEGRVASLAPNLKRKMYGRTVKINLSFRGSVKINVNYALLRKPIENFFNLDGF